MSPAMLEEMGLERYRSVRLRTLAARSEFRATQLIFRGLPPSMLGYGSEEMRRFSLFHDAVAGVKDAVRNAMHDDVDFFTFTVQRPDDSEVVAKYADWSRKIKQSFLNIIPIFEETASTMEQMGYFSVFPHAHSRADVRDIMDEIRWILDSNEFLGEKLPPAEEVINEHARGGAVPFTTE